MRGEAQGQRGMETAPRGPALTGCKLGSPVDSWVCSCSTLISKVFCTCKASCGKKKGMCLKINHKIGCF